VEVGGRNPFVTENADKSRTRTTTTTRTILEVRRRKPVCY
jgi:hypothetical protein